jgi:DNA-binding NtrC family response regulator
VATERAVKRTRGPGLDVLVVDDEPRQREILADILRDEGHRVSEHADGASALARLDERPAELLLTDLRMPGMDGHELLRAALERQPDLLVILMTAYATVSSAVDAMRDGAFDYLQKPFAKEELIQRVERAAVRRRLERENRALKRRLAEASAEGILGESEAVRTLLRLLDRAADGGSDVLLTGESGTGKELAARRIHFMGPAAAGPFVAVNCAAIPEALAESELFGHERGAFTSAAAARVGRFSQAHGGTLFLDEIGSMPRVLQAKLLRVLEDRIVERVGGGEGRKVELRVIAATNQDLREQIAAAHFREDLYHRLNVVEIEMPPLRDRGDDVLLLAERFRDRAAERTGTDPPEIGDDLRGFLAAYRFPGNVRELENLMERMVVLSEGEPLGLGDLPPSIVRDLGDPVAGAPGKAEPARDPDDPRRGDEAVRTGALRPEGLLAAGAVSLPEIERRLLAEAIRRSRGNLSEAAKRLGLTYKTMQYRARKFGLDRE